MNRELETKWPLGLPPNILNPIPAKMDALTIHRDDYGQPATVIRTEKIPVPRLNPEDATCILVAILATGPNFNTNFAALGLPVPIFGRGDGATIHIPGSDAVGIVVDAGPAVKRVKVGQAVILDSWTDKTLIRGYETHDGFNAQFAVVDQLRAVPIPETLKTKTVIQLAAMLLTYSTAYRAVVERLATGPSDSILLMGGGKGTSFAGAQIAKSLGARVLLMGSNPDLGKALIERGIANAFIDRRQIPRNVYGVLEISEPYDQWFQRTKPFRDAVFGANGGNPVNKIFDHTGGVNFPLLVSTLSQNGSIVFFGATGSGLKGEYKQTFFYNGQRLVMDARWVWMRQKQLIFRNMKPDDIFSEIGLLPGKKGLIWGADSYARAFVKAARARSADLVVLASKTKDAEGIRQLNLSGIDSRLIIDLDEFRLSDDMPDPLTMEGTPNSEYAGSYMNTARKIGRAIWEVFGPRVSPDFIVERPDQSTLHYSSFLVRDYNEFEETPCGIIVVKGDQNLSIRGSHMYRAGQAQEVVRLLAQKNIVMEKGDLEVSELNRLPEIQQKMLDGKMDKPKGVALVQADREDRSIDDFEYAFLGEIRHKADPNNQDYLDIHVASKIGAIVLKRLDALNALNGDLLSQLAKAVREIKDYKTLEGKPVKALVICSGARAFGAGADVNEFFGNSAEGIAKIADYNNQIFSDIENLGVPVISVIDGFALGGGNELAMSTHYRIVTENALLGQPEIKLGIFPGYGGMQRLPRLVGPRLAAEISINGEAIGGRAALEAGLVDEFAVSPTALRRAFRLAQEFSTGKQSVVMRDWDAVSTKQTSELTDLFKDKNVQELLNAPTPDAEEAKDIKSARKYAAKFVLESIRFGYLNGFSAGVKNDSMLFGKVAASVSGQEWIGRFIRKDPSQSAFCQLLPPR